MTRESWLRQEIERIKNGGTIRQRCVMATKDRLQHGLCRGDVPPERAHRGSHTCSPECQADRRRLMRWEQSKTRCRVCGHGFPRRRKVDPETGNVVVERSLPMR